MNLFDYLDKHPVMGIVFAFLALVALEMVTVGAPWRRR